jgi:hypothetical protein
MRAGSMRVASAIKPGLINGHGTLAMDMIEDKQDFSTPSPGGLTGLIKRRESTPLSADH